MSPITLIGSDMWIVSGTEILKCRQDLQTHNETKDLNDRGLYDELIVDENIPLLQVLFKVKKKQTPFLTKA